MELVAAEVGCRSNFENVEIVVVDIAVAVEIDLTSRVSSGEQNLKNGEEEEEENTLRTTKILILRLMGKKCC